MDIFPQEISEDAIPYPLVHPVDKKNFASINGCHTIEAFIPYIDRETVRYRIVYEPLVWKQRVLENFIYFGPKSYEQDVRLIAPDKYNWSAIKTRFDKAVHIKKMRKDVRMVFKWNKNFFLVNRLFTFGFRVVEPGTEHIYQLTRSPLVLFHSGRSHSSGCEVQCFDPAYECFYDSWEMGSGKCYRIEENLRYMIVAPAPCLFSLHIVRKGQQLGFECITADLTPADPRRVTTTTCSGDKKRMSRTQLLVENKKRELEKSRKRRRCFFGDDRLLPAAETPQTTSNPDYYFSPENIVSAASKPKSVAERIQELFYTARNFSPRAQLLATPLNPAEEASKVQNLCVRDVGNENLVAAAGDEDLLSQAFRAAAASDLLTHHDESSVELVIDQSLSPVLQQQMACDTSALSEDISAAVTDEDCVASAGTSQSRRVIDEGRYETISNPPSEAATIPYDTAEDPPSCATNFSAIDDSDPPPSLNSI